MCTNSIVNSWLLNFLAYNPPPKLVLKNYSSLLLLTSRQSKNRASASSSRSGFMRRESFKVKRGLRLAPVLTKDSQNPKLSSKISSQRRDLSLKECAEAFRKSWSRAGASSLAIFPVTGLPIRHSPIPSLSDPGRPEKSRNTDSSARSSPERGINRSMRSLTSRQSTPRCSDGIWMRRRLGKFTLKKRPC